MQEKSSTPSVNTGYKIHPTYLIQHYLTNMFEARTTIEKRRRHRKSLISSLKIHSHASTRAPILQKPDWHFHFYVRVQLGYVHLSIKYSQEISMIILEWIFQLLIILSSMKKVKLLAVELFGMNHLLHNPATSIQLISMLMILKIEDSSLIFYET